LHPCQAFLQLPHKVYPLTLPQSEKPYLYP